MYYWSTAFLSLLPFAIAGSIYLVASRVGRRAAESEAREDASAIETEPEPNPAA
jgi:hypothetical protein